MRFLLSLLLIVGFVSCEKSGKEKFDDLVKEWNGKQILYPSAIHFTALGTDTVYSLESKYKIITYVDSVGCTSCKLRLPQWKDFICQLDSIGDVPVGFFLYPKNRKELIYTLKLNNFSYPVCIDEKDSLNKLNHFPSDMMFQTFLLDKDNKVLAIGTPIHNPHIKELYLKIIQGEQIGKEDKSKQIKTRVDVDKTSVSMGNFGWQEEQKAVFALKNTGDNLLVIQDVTTSCGCTTVAYSREPVQPGGEATLKVAYKAEHPGYFKKTITVHCNAEPSPVKLTITGNAE